MNKAMVEEWFKEYGLMVNGLTDEQFEQFETMYDNGGADQIDNGDDFYEWMVEAAESLNE